jgi:hypothetical protein
MEAPPLCLGKAIIKCISNKTGVLGQVCVASEKIDAMTLIC